MSDQYKPLWWRPWLDGVTTVADSPDRAEPTTLRPDNPDAADVTGYALPADAPPQPTPSRQRAGRR
jgi:hypothetical protein